MSNSEEEQPDFFLTDPYSSYASLDETSRAKKANKIIRVLKKHVALERCDLLDIGTGSGHIIALIAQQCKTATSVNLNDERIVKEGYAFVQVNDVHLPFADESFDVVTSNQVIEHIPLQDIHLREIHRVLRTGGIAYLAAPSRFTLIEPHFRLPFLSWLPRPLAHGYVRLFGHARFDIYPLTLGRLKALLPPAFEVTNMSVEVIKHPQEYGLDMFPALQPLLKVLPRFLLRALQPLMPSFIVVLTKK